MQVYMCVYSRDDQDGPTQFLFFKKREKGYYFSSNSGSILKKGQPLNGGGFLALPGGRLESNENAYGAANREFWEETGINISSDPGIMRLIKRNGYSFIAFHVNILTLLNIATKARSNLIDSNAAALQIQKGKITKYSEIHQFYPDAPVDNELLEPCVYDYTDGLFKLLSSRPRDTGWFAEIVKIIMTE